MVGKDRAKGGQALVELSNAMVSLHRECYGRGPGAAKSILTEEMAICVLSDIYTPVERTLIQAGQIAHVRRLRGLHQEAQKERYKASVERIIGRSVAAFLSVAHVDPDVSIEIFLLGGPAAD